MHRAYMPVLATVAALGTSCAPVGAGGAVSSLDPPPSKAVPPRLIPRAWSVPVEASENAEARVGQTTTLGWSVEGRPIRGTLLGRQGDLVLVLGVIHGDEPAGESLVRALHRRLERHPEILAGRRVALVPVLNPDGFVHGRRLNSRGIDPNRNLPSDNWQPGTRRGRRPLSEPESRVIYDLIHRHNPARIITIHQPLGLVDYDGGGRDGRRLAKAIAARTHLTIEDTRERVGSLGEYAGRTLGIPVITLELPEADSRSSEKRLWRRYGAALLTAIRWPDKDLDKEWIKTSRRSKR